MSESSVTIEPIEAKKEGATARLIHVSGALDESNIDNRAQELYKLLEQYPKNLFLIFDLEKLDYMNSKTIGYITDWSSKISTAGGKMVLAHAPRNILDILETVGILTLIPAYPTVEEALKHLFE